MKEEKELKQDWNEIRESEPDSEENKKTYSGIYHIHEMEWTDLGGGHLDKAMVTDEKTGMLVNVSFYPKGYQMGWHKHSCAHGMYIIKGAMQTNLGLVKEGEFVWFEAGEEMDHGATVLEDCTFLFITNAPFDIEYLDPGQKETPEESRQTE